MLTTREAIVEAAIRLYNHKGFANTTSRHIAAEINISHGNLEYHFPNKEALVMEIYQRMRQEASGYYEDLNHDILNPEEHFHRLLLHLEVFQDKYKFFNLDVLEITRKHKKAGLLLRDTLQIRKTQMIGIFESFAKLGYLKPEPADGHYERLQHTIRMVITFWKSQQEILTNFDYAQKGEFVRHIWDLIIPHFTAKGIRAYQSVLRKFPIHSQFQ